MSRKPVVQLTGEDGNVFSLLGICSRALKKAGKPEDAKAMQQRVFGCGSYEEALGIGLLFAVGAGVGVFFYIILAAAAGEPLYLAGKKP